ncbi:hypothetical protein TNCV_371471 [Trichonephila clavipes]|nr:hypothetical protein TNCV_371471 [Trichonephila clavipes]
MTDISSCRRKVDDSSQQAPLLSNSVQQKGRQVSRFTVARRLHKWGLFTHRPERCLPLKVVPDATVYSGAESTKTGKLINGFVSSLRMRVGSAPEAILNAF